MFIIEESLKH